MLKKEIIYLIFISSINLISGQNKENWVQPNAWHRNIKIPDSNEISNSVDDIIEKECNCPTTTIAVTDILDGEKFVCPKSVEEINEQISLTYYKKLLKLLFHESKLKKYDDGVYRRTIEFELNEDELKILTNSADPRDWDPIVTDIFHNIKTPSRFVKFIEDEEFQVLSILNWFKNLFLSILSDPLIKFILFAALFILVVIYFSRKYRYGFFVMFLIGSFVTGYILTYLDCNKNLQIEELAGLWHSDKNPCENLQLNQKWSIWNIFSTKSTKEQCIEYLKQKHNMKLPFCRPDDVFLFYVNEKILNQFQMIVEKCTIIFKTTLEKFPFPYNIFAIAVFGFLLPLFIKMIFTHVIDLRIWFNRDNPQLRNSDRVQNATPFVGQARNAVQLEDQPKNAIQSVDQAQVQLEDKTRNAIRFDDQPKKKSILNQTSGVETVPESSTTKKSSVQEIEETVKIENVENDSKNVEMDLGSFEMVPESFESNNNNNNNNNKNNSNNNIKDCDAN